MIEGEQTTRTELPSEITEELGKELLDATKKEETSDPEKAEESLAPEQQLDKRIVESYTRIMSSDPKAAQDNQESLVELTETWKSCLDLRAEAAQIRTETGKYNRAMYASREPSLAAETTAEWIEEKLREEPTNDEAISEEELTKRDNIPKILRLIAAALAKQK